MKHKTEAETKVRIPPRNDSAKLIPSTDFDMYYANEMSIRVT